MFYKSTHTCERRAIWIDEKINIKDNFIHTSSLFIRKTDFLITEMYNWECFLHLEGIRNTLLNFSTSSSGFVALQNSGRHNIFSPVLKPDKLEGGGAFQWEILEFSLLLNKHRLNPKGIYKYRVFTQTVNRVHMYLMTEYQYCIHYQTIKNVKVIIICSLWEIILNWL